jgi:hypothetical protein
MIRNFLRAGAEPDSTSNRLDFTYY